MGSYIMKINLNNRSSFWNIKSKKNYTNDTLCILNDNFKINILLIPKCASSSIRNIIDYREKLFSELNDVEKEYTKICFVRPVEERFYSGLNTTIYKRNSIRTTLILDCIKQNNKDKLIEFIINNNDPHTTSINILLNNIDVDHIYKLSILKNLDNKNKSIDDKDNYLSFIKNMQLLKNEKIKKYYSNDYHIYTKSTSYVTPTVNKLFNNKLTIQKFLFILTPANCGSSVISSLLNSSINTTFSKNKKYEGILNIKPQPKITLRKNWYNLNFQPNYKEFLNIDWEDNLI